MSERNPGLLIEDMIEAASRILQYTEGITFEDFDQNQLIKDAVLRNFEVIGEAANRLPKEFKSKWKDIDWVRLRGFRNRIIHHYFGVDYSIIWEIKEKFLKQLIGVLRSIELDMGNGDLN